MSETHGSDDPFPLTWDARLETGVATIDLQHRVLFDLLLRTREACDRGQPVDLNALLQQLRAYADYHFRHEEEWLRSHAPSESTGAAHRRHHVGFLRRLDELDTRFRADALDVQPLLGFLSDWLMDHIARQDVPLIRPLAQGLAEKA